MTLKILVTGNLDCPYQLVKDKLDIILSKVSSELEIISFGYTRIDRHATTYAAANGLRYTVLEPDFKTDGSKAPNERNKRAIDLSDHCVIFGSNPYIMGLTRQKPTMKVRQVGHVERARRVQ